MSPKILLVQHDDTLRASFERALAAKYEVVSAANVHEARAALATRGPFAIAIADHDASAAPGSAFFAEVHARSSDTIGVLLAEVVDLEAALHAVHEGHASRIVTKPCDAEALCCAVDAAHARRLALEALECESEKLLFANESLTAFTAMLEERIDKQTASLRRMHRFAVDLNAAESMSDIVSLTARAASEVLGGCGVHVQVWDGKDEGLGVCSAVGPEMSARMHREPLCTRDGEIGEIAVDVQGAHGERLGPTTLSQLSSIASSCAVAAHNELRRRERDQAQHATILALARLSEQRDNETGSHLERVARYCKLAARGLREDGKHLELITDAWIEDLVRSSPLHDIGKVGVPDSILLKPGKLTPEEWEIMKTHAEIGALTLDGVIKDFGSQSFLSMGRDIAWCHHEKWDGSGYPRGLKGEAIPLAARILALADVYDALTTVRPYKSAWSHVDAIDWIRSRAGAHFDPDVAAGFLQRQEEADLIRGELADSIDAVRERLGEFAVHST